MGIQYKPGVIDYEKTLGSMLPGGTIVIHTEVLDIANIRTQVHKVSKRLPGMTFSVHKTPGGASIVRTS